jgi:hypothetical protein
MTPEQIADIFTEWQRQWQEDPDGFLSADEHFGQTPTKYGPRAARTFQRIAVELGIAE